MSVLNLNGVTAVAKRQLHSLLANPLGYVFIFAFVVIAGAVTDCLACTHLLIPTS